MVSESQTVAGCELLSKLLSLQGQKQQLLKLKWSPSCCELLSKLLSLQGQKQLTISKLLIFNKLQRFLQLKKIVFDKTKNPSFDGFFYFYFFAAQKKITTQNNSNC